jgi:hypothetical protein
MNAETTDRNETNQSTGKKFIQEKSKTVFPAGIMPFQHSLQRAIKTDKEPRLGSVSECSLWIAG